MASKVLIIYHKADYDGKFSRDVCLYHLEKLQTVLEVTAIGWDYGDPLPDITRYDEVYLVDISNDLLCAENKGKIIWIDHHATAIEKYGNDWRGIRLSGVAACRLCWQYFFNPLATALTVEDYKNRTVAEPAILTLAGEYDVWDKHDPNADTLQYGLRAKKFGTEEAMKYFRNWESDLTLDSDTLSSLLEAGRIAQSYGETVDAAAAARAHEHRWEGINWLMLNTASGNSKTFASRVTQQHEALLMWRYDGTKVTVSMYGVPHRPDLNLAAIAISYGGGGHKQACGFTCSLRTMLDILELNHKDIKT